MSTRLSPPGRAAVVGVGVVLALAVVGSVMALRSTRRVAAISSTIVSDNLPSVRAAEELEIALLEERGLVSAYLLDGNNAEWLQELELRRPRTEFWLREARRTAHSAVEVRLLGRIESTYHRYVAQRARAIALHHDGQQDQAVTLLLGGVRRLSEESNRLCDQLVDANQQYIEASVSQQRVELLRATTMVAIGLVLTAAAGLGLLLLLFRYLLKPLQGLADYARSLEGSPVREPVPTADEFGAIGHSLRSLVSDLTRTREDLAASQARIAHAEALASVGKLSACVAHEIRNPLTAMRLWLHSLRAQGKGDPEIESRCDHVATEIGRLDHIVREFLEFSRPPRLEIAPVELSEVIRRTLDRATPRVEQTGASLVVENEGNGTLVQADADQLQQVFFNLLANAADATGPGGSIRLHAGLERNGDEPRRVRVRVENTGPALPDTVRARLFEPFVTTKPGGTGLGLAIAASIVARHGGQIVVDADRSEGCAFDVWIPVTKEPAA